jgi:type I restriction enzyme R subunit/putative DNA methylase
MYLAPEPIADVVMECVHRGVQLGHYDLGAYAILSHHVHVLLWPKILPSRLRQSLKGTTARQAILILRRTGETFWQAESYDHWARNDAEWQRMAAYMEENPVKAGLVACASAYRWSSAWNVAGSAETSLGAADTHKCLRHTHPDHSS